MPPRVFRESLTAAVRDAMGLLSQRLGDEHLYSFALYTSGETEFSYVCASANTDEGLARTLDERMKSQCDGRTRDQLDRELRWSTPDWVYHDFSPDVGRLELPGGRAASRDSRVYSDFIHALKTIDAEGLFGTGKAREAVTVLVVCGDMGDEFMRRGLRKLNTKAVVKRYLDEYCPDQLLERLFGLQNQRTEQLVRLYVDLALERTGPWTSESRRYGLDRFVLESRLPELGAAAISLIIAIVEEFGLGQTFNERGTEAFRLHGAFTREAALASSAAFLIPEFGPLSNEHIQTLQGIIRRRNAIDRDHVGPVSCLTENVARVLHIARPQVFPATQMCGKTNRLINIEAFLGG